MLVELDKVIEILEGYSNDDMYWWGGMIEEIKELGNPNPKPEEPDPDPFGDRHCIAYGKRLPEAIIWRTGKGILFRVWR